MDAVTPSRSQMPLTRLRTVRSEVLSRRATASIEAVVWAARQGLV